MILGALFPSAGAAVGGLLAWGVRYILGVTRLLRRIPCAAVYMSNPLNVLWLIFVYAMLLTVWLMSRKGRKVRPVVPVCLSLIFLYAAALTVRLS